MDISEFHSKERGDDTFAVGSSSSKLLIDRITNNNDINAFRELYEYRKVWCRGYPLIHGRSTYGMFGDLSLSTDMKTALVPVTMDVALNESIEYFHCALFALNVTLPTDQILRRPIGFGEQLLTLRERVRKYSFLPNLTATWGDLATRARCLKPVESDRSYAISARRMGVDMDDYLNFFPCPLPNIPDDDATCPLSKGELITLGINNVDDGTVCQFETSALIDTAKWWIYSYPLKAPHSGKNCFVFIRASQDGRLETSYRTCESLPMPDWLMHQELLQREFTVRK